MNAPSGKFVTLTRASVGSLIAGLILSWAFVQFGQHRLSHTDLWGHLAYGRYIAQEGKFPDREPFLQTSTDQELVVTAWLSQWGGYHLYRSSGAVGLQLAYAVIVSGSLICFCYLILQKSRSWTLALIGTAWFLVLEQQQVTTIRPQLMGLLGFLLFLAIGNPRQKLTRLRYGALFVLMVVWTNAHGSFAIAPVILIISLSGRLLDVLRRHYRRGTPLSRTIQYLRGDQRLHRHCYLLGVVLIATLVTPFGTQLWREVLTFGKSPNLYDLIEWMPLWKTPKQGTAFLLSGFAVLAVFLVKRYRLRMETWLPVFALTVQLIRVSRYFVWWSPLFVKAMIPDWRLAERWKRYSRIYAVVEHGMNLAIPGGRFVLLAVAMVALSWTPWSAALFHGQSWSPRNSFSMTTPIEATVPLLELAPETLMFNTMEWGDWLIWESEATLPVFVNSHVTLIDEEVWRDYMSFIRQSTGWKEHWDSYTFSVAIVQYRRHKELARSLQDDPEWEEVYEDSNAKIFVNKSRDNLGRPTQ
ncbi:MAG: hypothetical protein HUJ26_10815 [Planctomycetaceae bacterium]|nr:hypothetical protein [Planctomycetaceae bacterium]